MSSLNKSSCTNTNMASNLFFWLALFSTCLVFTSCRKLCPRIFFQNINEDTMPYKMIEGVYINKENDYYNNFPVYRRENDRDLGLYYHNDENGEKLLAFGNDFGNGSWVEFGVSARLSNDPLSWLSSGTLNKSDVFSGLVHQWQYNNRSDETNYNVPVTASSPMIKAVCVDEDFRECNSERVYLNERIDGKFRNILNAPKTDYFHRVEGLFRNLRPVYKHSAVSWYMQYVDRYWVISESYRPSTSEENVIMRVKDLALRPEYITKTWSRWSFGWHNMPKLRVLCRGVTSMSNICPSNPCNNKATCVYTPSKETLCVCTSGFTGLTCSVKKQCPSTNNFQYLAKRPGDLGMSFCSESYPSTRFYLCVDVDSSSYWSRQGSFCKVQYGRLTSTPTATRDSVPNLRTEGAPKAKPIISDGKPFPAVPIVITVVIVLQILPLLVLWCYSSCKKKSKEAKYRHSQVEKSHIGKKVGRRKRMEAKDHNRKMEQQSDAGEEVGSVRLPVLRVVSLAEGDEELEKGLYENQWEQKRKERGLYKSQYVKLCRLTSMYMSFLFYLWLIFLVVCEVSQCTSYGEVFHILRIFAIVMLCLSPAIVLMESFFCDELDYLKNILEDETASEYIQRMCSEAPPKVDMVVECYHYETDTRLLPRTDASVNKTFQFNRTRKIVTFVDREVFSFDSWDDGSIKEMPEVRNTALARVQFDSKIEFGNRETADAFESQMAEMVRRNRDRDSFCEYKSTKEVPGLKKRFSAYVDLNLKPFWIRPLFFWIATLLQMTWPYRWLLRAKTAKRNYVLKKKVYKSTITPRALNLNTDPVDNASSVA